MGRINVEADLLIHTSQIHFTDQYTSKVVSQSRQSGRFTVNEANFENEFGAKIGGSLEGALLKAVEGKVNAEVENRIKAEMKNKIGTMLNVQVDSTDEEMTYRYQMPALLQIKLQFNAQKTNTNGSWGSDFNFGNRYVEYPISIKLTETINRQFSTRPNDDLPDGG